MEGVDAEQDIVDGPVDVDRLVERLGVVLVASDFDQRLVQPLEIGVAEGGVVALVFECTGLDRSDGEETLVIKQRPVERDQDVDWKGVFEPRSGSGRSDEIEDDGEKDQGQVEAVEQGVEGEGKRGSGGCCVKGWGHSRAGVLVVAWD